MARNTGFNKNWRKWFLNDVVKAIETYSMIKEGAGVCVALSGGKDSTTLLYILYLLTRYSHLNFNLSALHIKTDDYNTALLGEFCSELEIPYYESLLRKDEQQNNDKPCYICSRLKRGAISEILEEKGIQTVAYGHHADDIAETFFMNIVQNRKFGSFSPVVSVEGSGMTMIRPLIYLEEKEIQKIHNYFGLPLLDHSCSYEDLNLRAVYKNGVKELNDLLKTEGFSKKMVNALENIDLTNIWSEMKKG